MNPSSRVGLLALSVTLVACGGGGSSGAGNPTPLPAVVEAQVAWANTGGGSSDSATAFNNSVATHEKGWSVVVGLMTEATDLYDVNGKSYGTFSAPQGEYCAYLARYETDGTIGWARPIGGDESSTAKAMAVALMSNSKDEVVVTGHFSGNLTLSDPDRVKQGLEPEVSLSASGGSDIFVARYSSGGDLLWGRQVGGSRLDQGLCVCALNDGKAAVGGLFSGKKVVFGTGEGNETTLSATGAFDGFVATYQADGSLEWARAFQAENSLVHSMVWSIAGNVSDGFVVVGGGFSGSSMNVASIKGDADLKPLSSAGKEDVFLARFEKDGTRTWHVSAGGSDNEDVWSVALSPVDSAVLVTGGFYGSPSFEGKGLDSGDSANENAYVASYDQKGGFLWATQCKGPTGGRGAIGLSVAADSDGGAIMVGWFSEKITHFGDTELKTPLESKGSHDIFMVRLKPEDGSFDWANSLGTGDGDAATLGVAIVPAGQGEKQSVVLCGYYVGSATFGAGETHETTLQGSGVSDAFVARFTPDGN